MNEYVCIYYLISIDIHTFRATSHRMPESIPDSLLSLAELLLEAQLKAVRDARRSAIASMASPTAGPRRRGAPRSGNSQLDVVFNILKVAGQPVHISEILARAAAAGSVLERESIVSALTKRIQRADRFIRTAPNTFALRPEALAPTPSVPS